MNKKGRLSDEIIVTDYKKEFLKDFKELTYAHRSWDIWKDFVTMAACAFSNAVDKSHYEEREEMYMKIVKKYKKKEVELFPKLLADLTMALDRNPEQDFLGEIFMDLNLGNESTGQFFTPYDICAMMAKICETNVVDAVKENGYCIINDPCCGAGATLIAGIHEAKLKLEKEGYNYQDHILVTGQDVDPIAAMMCYIQLSLQGVAGYIKIGNSLTNPMTDCDDLDNYWFTPMYFSEVWSFRRMIRKFIF